MKRVLWVVIALSGCQAVLGIDEREVYRAPDGGGGSAGSSSGGSGGTSSGGTSAVGGTGGATGGSGGMAGGSAGSPGDASSDATADAPDASVHGTHVLSNSYGSANDQAIRAGVSDSQGNFIVAGVFQDQIDFGGGTLDSLGSFDIFVAKLDAGGKHVWSKRFGDAGDQSTYMTLAVDSQDDVVLVGDFQGSVDFGDGPLTSQGQDIFVAKLDPQGGALWSKRFGGPAPEFGRGGFVDPSGNIYITGHHDSGSVDFGCPSGAVVNADGHADAIVVKLDSNGKCVWSKGFAASNANAFCGAVMTDASGDVVIAGNTEGSLNLGGGSLSFGGYKDAYLAKLSRVDGSHMWSKTFGDGGWQQGDRLATESNGTIVFAGFNWATGATPAKINLGGSQLSSYGGAFLARFTSAGVHLESHVYEGLTRASVLAVDSADHIYLGGTMEQPADLGGGALTHAGGWDVAVVEWAPGMKHVFSNSYGAAPDEDVTGIGFDLSGNLWLAGYYRATIDFGGGPLVTKGGIDSFVAKLTP